METSMILKIIFFAITIPLAFSLAVTIFLFYQFISNRELHHRKTNLVLIILLSVTFLQSTIEIPMDLVYLRTGLAAHSSTSFCLFWIFCTYLLDATALFLMSFAAFERYLFIFHTNLLNRYPIIFRWIPLALCFIYPFFYYIGVVYIYPCQGQYIFFSFLCGGGCFVSNPLWNSVFWIGNICTPVFFIVLVNALVVIRTIIQKNRMRQRNIWTKNRKMILQLVSVASLYVIAWVPSMIIILIITFSSANVDVSSLFVNFRYVIFMTILVPLFYPYVCLLGQPDIVKKIRQVFKPQRIIPTHVSTGKPEAIR